MRVGSRLRGNDRDKSVDDNDPCSSYDRKLAGTGRLLPLRTAAQITIALFNIWLGWRLYLFYEFFANNRGGLVPRPPGIEAYLPISALLSLKYWLFTGLYDTIHPAGLTILIAALLSTLIFRRGFCSWICPVGTLSEGLWRLGAKIFGRTFTPPGWVDIPLRTLKYFALAFFVYITAVMSPLDIKMFLGSTFNRMADVQMLRFFMLIGSTGVIVLSILVLGSLLTKNFWCRYVCPYGAMLGIVSLASPVAVERDSSKCTQCHTCDAVCPARIKVSSKRRVNTPECTSCLACVENCPQGEVLRVRAAGARTKVMPPAYGTMLIGFFFAIILAAQLSGHWQTNISLREYKRLIPRMGSSGIQHP